MNRRDALLLSGTTMAAGALSLPRLAAATSTTSALQPLIDYLASIDALAAQLGFSDPQGRAGFERLALLILSGANIGVFGTRIENPDWVPYIPYFLPYIAPNPDTVYRFAPIDPHGTYRLSGHNGTESVAAITLRDGGAHLGKPSGNRVAEIDLLTLKTDAKRNFDFILSNKRPPEHKGEWIALPEATNCLMTRHVLKSEQQTDGVCVIERLDRSSKSLAPTPEELADQVTQVARNATTLCKFSIDYFNGLRKRGADKALILDDQTAYGGLLAQSYYFHLYDLAPDEALIAESDAPAAKYWSIQLFDPYSITLDFVARQTSLNDAQAQVDPDGRIRIVISHTDPLAANWLDAAGWTRGGLLWRWNETKTAPQPSIRKVKLSELGSALPASSRKVTSEQRLAMLSARARFYQSRRR
ncbi:MAG: DUF1214 domain-containing protein [Steroidobacteraceae bacterium]